MNGIFDSGNCLAFGDLGFGLASGQCLGSCPCCQEWVNSFNDLGCKQPLDMVCADDGVKTGHCAGKIHQRVRTSQWREPILVAMHDEDERSRERHAKKEIDPAQGQLSAA
jgi:hypothetical protein